MTEFSRSWRGRGKSCCVFIVPRQLLTSASWVKKIGGAGSWNFPTDSCKFPTEEIMDAHNSNFASKCCKNGGFSTPYFSFLDEHFRRVRKFFDNFFCQPHFFFWGGANAFSCPPLPRRRLLTLRSQGCSVVMRQTRDNIITDDVQSSRGGNGR